MKKTRAFPLGSMISENNEPHKSISESEVLSIMIEEIESLQRAVQDLQHRVLELEADKDFKEPRGKVPQQQPKPKKGTEKKGSQPVSEPKKQRSSPYNTESIEEDTQRIVDLVCGSEEMLTVIQIKEALELPSKSYTAKCLKKITEAVRLYPERVNGNRVYCSIERIRAEGYVDSTNS